MVAQSAADRGRGTRDIVECAAERLDGRSDAEHRNEKDEETAADAVPLMATGTGEGARFQNELPPGQDKRGDPQPCLPDAEERGGSRTAEDGTAQGRSEDMRELVECAAEWQEERSDEEQPNEEAGNSVVPLILTGTGEGARFQNEPGQRQDRARNAEDGSEERRDIVASAGERPEGRSDAELQNDDGSGERMTVGGAPERVEGRNRGDEGSAASCLRGDRAPRDPPPE